VKKIWFFILIIFLCNCSHKKKEKIQISYPIEKAKAKVKDVPIYIEAIGHVEAINSVEVRSRVEGELMQVNFEEGAYVKKNDLLIVIDPKPFILEVQRSKALLQQNKANLRIAADKLKRYTPLLKDEYISELNYDELLTNVQQLRALVRQNKVEVQSAILNLKYCYITSPIDGKTSLLNIKQGNLISINSSTPLLTINQINPIHVVFTMPENNLTTIQKYLKKENELKVIVSTDNFHESIEKGKLTVIDNSVDPKVAMIKLRALFDNSESILWPKEFVKTKLILTIEKNAIVIPYQAIQTTPSGTIVFVVKDDEVELRKVKLGQRIDEEIIIKKGIKKNEEIVIKGQLNLSDKSKVFISKLKKV